jgi:hypothetical protein
MGGALGWVLNPGGEAANLVVPISPHTQSLIGAIEAADPPCSSGNTVQDWVCWGGTLAAGEVYGRARQALEKTGPHGAVVGTLLNFGEGAVGNASDFMRAVRIGADAGVPGYAYDAVTMAGRRVTLYADATRVPGGDRRRSFPRWTGRSRWFSSARTTDRYWMLRRRGLLTTPRARCIPTWATRRGLTQPTPPRVRGAT